MSLVPNRFSLHRLGSTQAAPILKGESAGHHDYRNSNTEGRLRTGQNDLDARQRPVWRTGRAWCTAYGSRFQFLMGGLSGPLPPHAMRGTSGSAGRPGPPSSARNRLQSPSSCLLSPALGPLVRRPSPPRTVASNAVIVLIRSIPISGVLGGRRGVRAQERALRWKGRQRRRNGPRPKAPAKERSLGGRQRRQRARRQRTRPAVDVCQSPEHTIPPLVFERSSITGTSCHLCSSTTSTTFFFPLLSPVRSRISAPA